MKIVSLSKLICHFIVAVSLFFSGACKKNSDTPNGSGSDYYMRFRINGALIEHKGQAEGNFNKATSSSYAASFAGLKEALVAGKNNMSVILGTEAENKTGVTYTNYTTATSGSEKAKVLNIVYLDDAGNAYLSWAEEFAPAIPSGTKTNAQVKITEAASAYLKGSFSGTLYNNDYTKEFSITEGEFYVRRIN
ncbi:hypothetical protein DC498_01690 [Terrimonas sp.]|uniref:hypothetical protein n=1 Tax=Terrimonas sp. TaxID=1914338 RepID=UPI000D50F7BC|nr:hypothetical protein [Terrimonas sp.]PVD54127.1 hypothetical protein DC498_01690 [Terrimonas sp.]